MSKTFISCKYTGGRLNKKCKGRTLFITIHKYYHWSSDRQPESRMLGIQKAPFSLGRVSPWSSSNPLQERIIRCCCKYRQNNTSDGQWTRLTASRRDGEIPNLKPIQMIKRGVIGSRFLSYRQPLRGLENKCNPSTPSRLLELDNRWSNQRYN